MIETAIPSAPLSIEPAPADEYFGVECRIPAAVPGHFALEFEV